MYFFYVHELGHAVITEFDLDYTGSKEDAADEFAALALAQHSNVVAVIYDVAMYYKFRQMDGYTTTAGDEHNPDDRRAAAIFCVLYGANPQAYSDKMLTFFGLSNDNARDCIAEYPSKLRRWQRKTAPFVNYPVFKLSPTTTK